MLTNAPIIRNTQASKEHLLIALRPRIQHIINHLNKRENVRSIERIELCLQKYHQLLPNILRIPILQKLLKRISVQAGVLLADIRFLKAHTAEEASYFFIINQIQIINFVPDHILLDILHAQKALIPLIQNIFLFKIGVQLSKKWLVVLVDGFLHLLKQLLNPINITIWLLCSPTSLVLLYVIEAADAKFEFEASNYNFCLVHSGRLLADAAALILLYSITTTSHNSIMPIDKLYAVGQILYRKVRGQTVRFVHGYGSTRLSSIPKSWRSLLTSWWSI